jgi:hypothetical protein
VETQHEQTSKQPINWMGAPKNLAWGNKNLKINKTESFYSLVAIILD